MSTNNLHNRSLDLLTKYGADCPMGYAHITIFHIMYIALPFAGFFLFGSIARVFLEPGLVLGSIGITGAVCGFYLALRIDRWAWHDFCDSFKRMSTDELWAIVNNGQWNMMHTMALLNLAVRNQDISAEKKRVLELMGSERWEDRIHAQGTLRMVYTEDALKIDDYDPKEAVAICRMKVARLSA